MVPHRWWLLGLSAVTCLGAVVGTVQLATDTFTPPVSDLEPLGLESWRLPAAWLFLSVAVPCAVTAWLAARDSVTAATAAVVAAALLAVELLVQIPFVGLDPLQAALGCVAVALGALGLDARRRSAP